ncbi:hypothetical protein [Streptomyces sp. NPDC088910]|uniref:hypothetical protein n=1 Tax=Streptomyces sp. NPDC088910 TaxID=3365911 RepID=UPI003806715A
MLVLGQFMPEGHRSASGNEGLLDGQGHDRADVVAGKPTCHGDFTRCCRVLPRPGDAHDDATRDPPEIVFGEPDRLGVVSCQVGGTGCFLKDVP